MPTSFAVVVSGLPGSGKSTVAAVLRERLGLPVLSKDVVKEALADALELPLPLDRRTGLAAVRVVLALAADAPRVVLDSFWWPGVAERDLVALGRPLVQVHCDCAPELARERFEQRQRDGSRHPAQHGMDDWQRFAPTRGRLDLPGVAVVVDTAAPLDADALVHRVAAALPAG